MSTRPWIHPRRLAALLVLGAFLNGRASATIGTDRDGTIQKEQSSDPVGIQFRVGNDLDGKNPRILTAPRVVTPMGVAAELRTQFGEGKAAQNWSFRVIPVGRLVSGVFCLVELDLGGRVLHRYVTLKDRLQKIQLTTLTGEALEVGIERFNPGLVPPVAIAIRP